MAHQVLWTEKTFSAFKRYGNLNPFQIRIMETRINNMTITQQSMLLNCSKSTIDKEIKKLKALYDVVQSQHPNELPPRKESARELYMDSH